MAWKLNVNCGSWNYNISLNIKLLNELPTRGSFADIFSKSVKHNNGRPTKRIILLEIAQGLYKYQTKSVFFYSDLFFSFFYCEGIITAEWLQSKLIFSFSTVLNLVLCLGKFWSLFEYKFWSLLKENTLNAFRKFFS